MTQEESLDYPKEPISLQLDEIHVVTDREESMMGFAKHKTINGLGAIARLIKNGTNYTRKNIRRDVGRISQR